MTAEERIERIRRIERKALDLQSQLDHQRDKWNAEVQKLKSEAYPVFRFTYAQQRFDDILA